MIHHQREAEVAIAVTGYRTVERTQQTSHGHGGRVRQPQRRGNGEDQRYAKRQRRFEPACQQRRQRGARYGAEQH